MYKSPIEIIQGELQTELDGAIMKAVQKVNIIVDKDQLLRALAYDREQYQLGFRDGKARAIDELVRCKDCMHMDTDKCPSKLNDADFYCCQGERREDGEIH